jgi:hypothetical protein
MELYDHVVTIAKSYLGPAAEEYIERRCRVSLKVTSPEEFKKEHLQQLAEAVELTVTVYLSEEKSRQFKKDILALEND